MGGCASLTLGQKWMRLGRSLTSTSPATKRFATLPTTRSTSASRWFSETRTSTAPTSGTSGSSGASGRPGRLLLDVEVDEALWEAGRAEGYVSFPPLLDGGLQSFLYDLMLGADRFAIPLRAENVTFLGAASVPRLVCQLTYPGGKRYEVDDKGQYDVPNGEWVSGRLNFYDEATGALTLHVGKYVSFISYPRRVDQPHSKHRIVWQPKHVSDCTAIANRLPEGEIEPSALLAALERVDTTGGDVRVCRALEFAGSRSPEQTVLQRCVEHLSREDAQSEFWLVADDERGARANYDAFHGHDATLRFDFLDPSGRHEAMLETGLLRQNAAEVLFLHQRHDAFTENDWRFWRKTAVAGGLALVSHEQNAKVEPGAGWTVLRAGRQATLLQAPLLYGNEEAAAALPGPRWAMGDPANLAEAWTSRFNAHGVHAVPFDSLASGGPFDPEACPDAANVQAIDFFCDLDPEDPTGERATWRFVALIQSLVPYRIEHAKCRCRVTVATRTAAFDAEDARGSALWGAVRSMAMEVAEEAKLEFRLVDLGTNDDLATLAWLARHDLRERELAVRDGRLWVPRVVSNRDEYPRVPAGENPPYRLFLDNAGQISGLRMKTYDPPLLGPHHVEIDVAAAALNFRDVMVTLGLLPELAYERSAFGHELGMEASGVVRRAGMAATGLEPGDEVIFVNGGCIGKSCRGRSAPGLP